MTTLVLIDGVTYQIALPRKYVSLQAKQVLMFTQEFGGGIIPCTFTHIKPMEADGLPFNISDSKDES
ncbi:hypothetical protein ACH4RN_000952 [Providencia rettgeri]